MVSAWFLGMGKYCST
uniref:Uncharacterized protein n=1 Tax=Anguilla anguilla TaxID=7936 RepID=A0A0E9VA05_ANGAN